MDYLKQWTLAFYAQGLAPSAIADVMTAEGHCYKAWCIKHYLKTGTIQRCTNQKVEDHALFCNKRWRQSKHMYVYMRIYGIL